MPPPDRGRVPPRRNIRTPCRTPWRIVRRTLNGRISQRFVHPVRRRAQHIRNMPSERMHRRIRTQTCLHRHDHRCRRLTHQRRNQPPDRWNSQGRKPSRSRMLSHMFSHRHSSHTRKSTRNRARKSIRIQLQPLKRKNTEKRKKKHDKSGNLLHLNCQFCSDRYSRSASINMQVFLSTDRRQPVLRLMA